MQMRLRSPFSARGKWSGATSNLFKFIYLFVFIPGILIYLCFYLKGGMWLKKIKDGEKTRSVGGCSPSGCKQRKTSAELLRFLFSGETRTTHTSSSESTSPRLSVRPHLQPERARGNDGSPETDVRNTDPRSRHPPRSKFRGDVSETAQVRWVPSLLPSLLLWNNCQTCETPKTC